jgi:hypothetical protein
VQLFTVAAERMVTVLVRARHFSIIQARYGVVHRHLG